MDHPTKQIPHVIHLLTEGSPEEQKTALETYFLPTASFTHPLCRVPSFAARRIPLLDASIDSRWVIGMIYRWYKILSPRIQVTVTVHTGGGGAGGGVQLIPNDGPQTQTLFIDITQIFQLFFVPWQSPLHLTTILRLERHPNPNPDKPQDQDQNQAQDLYYIAHQEDLYQSHELLKIFLPHQITDVVMLGLQLLATLLCVLGALAGAPVTALQQRRTVRAKIV